MNELKAELHCHSFHSRGTKIRYDGIHSPKELVENALKKGIDVLAVTDHNTLKGSIEAEKHARNSNLLILKGEEVSTKEGHLLALGIQEELPEGIPLDEALDSIHSQGGIAVAPHPFDLKNEGIKKNALKCDAIESFNAINLDRISNFKAKRFAEKNNLIQVSGSDAHCTEMMGNALIEVKAEKDTDPVLKAIRNGNISLSNPTYTPVGVIQYYALRKLQLSFPFVQKYILDNYAHPKKFLSLRMLNLVQKSPGRIDYFFKFLTYFSYSSTLFYAFGRELVLPIKR